MRSLILVAILAAGLAAPAAAHVPESCQSKLGALLYAFAMARMAHEALDPSAAGVEPLVTYVEALKKSVAAGLELARCVDEE